MKGFALGEQLEVIGKSDNMVRVRSDDGYHTKIKALPLGAPETFSVHERDTIEICEGDRIRITANGRSEDGHRLNNGSIYVVDHISHDGKLVLENGRRLGPDFKHLQYGYTLTSHAAQGKTVDRVFLAQSPELSAGASDLIQFLVSISRGSKGLKVYTTDIELLRENVCEVRERLMATELLHGESEEKAPEETRGRTSVHLGTQEMEKEPEMATSAALGRTRPEISEDKAQILRKARKPHEEITAPAPKERRRCALPASEQLGQSGPEMIQEHARVLQKAPAVEREIEITPPRPKRERKREREQEMAMGMGM